MPSTGGIVRMPDDDQLGEMEGQAMLDFEVLVAGSFLQHQLCVRYDDQCGRIPLPPQRAAQLEQAWVAHTRWTRSNNLEPCNDQLVRLVDLRVNERGSVLHLELSGTDYREFVGTRTPDLYDPRDRAQLANPLGTSAVVITADHKILCGRRPINANINPGRYFLLGGFMTPADLASPDGLFGGIVREIHEETGIAPGAHQQTYCTGLVYDTQILHPELCFSTHVTETFDTICTYQSQDREVIKLESIDNDPHSVAGWLMQLHGRQLVGTAEACLLLHGRLAFGEAWFDTTLSALDALAVEMASA
ncbi:MAG: NUDIX hydrolase [Chloroflexota bacterium]|nr:NUDIX hydrolase [Chloroflexota bacterium]